MPKVIEFVVELVVAPNDEEGVGAPNKGAATLDCVNNEGTLFFSDASEITGVVVIGVVATNDGVAMVGCVEGALTEKLGVEFSKPANERAVVG